MKVGDYVRTLDGISKVIECKDNRFVNEGGNIYFYEDIIGNPSQNIIDLIEIGDYVNGYKVIKIENVEGYPELLNVTIEKSDFRYGVHETLFKKDIKSIVTKEQFSSMEYKI